MRIGVFGGSFDPIHVGHLLLAETCREAAALDRVLLTPAHQPPHKRRELSDGSHRMAMVQLAVSGDEALRGADLELQRGGTSFTVDTLRILRQEYPHAELFLLMGADSLMDLPNWRSPEEILQLAEPASRSTSRRAAAGHAGVGAAGVRIPHRKPWAGRHIHARHRNQQH